MHARRPRTGGRIRAPSQPAAHADPKQAWTVVSTALAQIYGRNSGSLSFETTFRSAYLMVLQKAGTQLYNGSRTRISQLVAAARDSLVVPLLPTHEGVDIEHGGIGAGAEEQGLASKSSETNEGSNRSNLELGDEGPGDMKLQPVSVGHAPTGGDEKENSTSSASNNGSKPPNDDTKQQQQQQQQQHNKVTFAGSNSHEGNIDFLEALESLWAHHKTCKEAYKGILMYADRVHVPACGVPTIDEMVTDIFRDVVLLNDNKRILNTAINAILYEIERHREKVSIPESTIKHIVDMLCTLGTGHMDLETGQERSLYTEYFLQPFLDSTRRHYINKSKKLLVQYDTPGYLKQVELRLEDEHMRVLSYLNKTTLNVLLKVTIGELLECHLKDIVDCNKSGLVSMFDRVDIQNLSLMYTLLEKSPSGHNYLRKNLCIHIKALCDIVNTVGNVKNPDLIKRQQMQQQRLKHHLDTTAMQNGPDSPTAEGVPPVRTGSSSSIQSIAESTKSSIDDFQSNTSLDDVSENSNEKLAKTESGYASLSQVPQGTSIATHWVRQMILLKEKIDEIVIKSFGSNNSFETDLYQELQNGINSHLRAPEFISLYIDENLRKSLKDMSEEKISSVLDKAIDMFRFVKSKDVFERYYKQHLAKRLLLNKTVSEDIERLMISKLKAECGYQFTSKLEGMFKDMSLSYELITEYKQQLATEARSSTMELNASVLTATYWPINTTTSTNQKSTFENSFPMEVKPEMERFKNFYSEKHQGRQLTWLPHLGNVDLRVYFDKGRKEVNVSTFGMMILVGVFNDLKQDEKISFKDIKSKLPDISELDLKRTLQSLSLSKNKILLKNTKTKTVVDTDLFIFNRKFTSPNHKIKILQVAGGESGHRNGGSSTGPKSSSSTSPGGLSTSAGAEARLSRGESSVTEMLDKVDESRRHQIEACIVRIMKSRRTMNHNLLIGEVIKQMASRFSPDPLMIKTRIEELIDREYLERTPDDRSVYTYLA